MMNDECKRQNCLSANFTSIAGCIGLCGKQCMRDVPPKLAIYFKLLAIWVEKLETSDPPKLAI